MKWKAAASMLLAIGAQSTTAQAQSKLMPVPANPAPVAVAGQAIPATPAPSLTQVIGAPHQGTTIIGAAGMPIIAEGPLPVEAGGMDVGGLKLSGFIAGGYIYNTDEPTSRYNGPYNAIDRRGGDLNQVYLIAEKGLSDSFGVGGRVDVIYGTDFLLAQSRGFENRDNGASHWNNLNYGLAIPQAYGEVGSSTFSAKAGHFYSIVGYEGLPATSSFFYSKAYSYQFASPFTHWGTLATWKPGNLQVQAGIVNGWNAFDREEDNPNFLGGIKYTADSQMWWTSFAIVTGAGSSDAYNIDANETRYSLIFDIKPAEKLEYVFHHWYGSQNDLILGNKAAIWYGIDQYLYYTINDCWKAGARFEWFNDDDGVRIGLNRRTNPNKPPFVGSAYSASFGVNWMPSSNLILRPELRVDWFDGQRNPYDDGFSRNQFLLGFDAIVKF